MPEAVVNYLARMVVRPRYHANDSSRDVLDLDPRTMPIADLRDAAEPPTLDREGFQLVPHASAVTDWQAQAGSDLYRQEVHDLILALSGADAVVTTSAGILRFSEKSAKSGKLDNSKPARFIHIDISDPTAAAFAARSAPEGKTIARFCHYNVWRTFSGAPQDVPLAVCDARSIAPEDLVAADAVFDKPGAPEWSFEGLCVLHNPDHRWAYFRDMTPGEALVFKTNDSDPARAHNVPHSAFNDPTAPPDTHPRASVEARGIAYWFE
jgi:hypothetical protein